MRISKIIIIAVTVLLARSALAHEGKEHSSGPGAFGLSAEYVHVLLNPFPVYGLAVGVLGLAAGLWTRSRAAQTLALGLVIFTALCAWPAFHYGENAYQSVRHIAARGA